MKWKMVWHKIPQRLLGENNIGVLGVLFEYEEGGSHMVENYQFSHWLYQT